MRCLHKFAHLCLIICVTPLFLAAQTPTPGQNVNMVSGIDWPWGDPFLERQNEPQMAVSTRNPLHLMAGANDYRTVDINVADQLPTEQLAGDAWLGLFESLDGGRRWQSTLIPGYPQDTSATGMSSPLHGLSTASDPVVRAGTNGMLYFGGIAFNRGSNKGVVFLSRFIDLNDREGLDIRFDQSPIRYIGTTVVDTGSAGQFLDKPQIAVDIPRGGAGTCSFPQIKRPDGTTVPQSFPAGTVYMAWAEFVGSQNLIRSKVRLSKSLDCGATWSNPVLLSQTYAVNNGPSIAVDPETGYVYVAWRAAAAANNPDAIVLAKSTDGGNTFPKAVQVIGLQPYNSTTPNAPSLFDEQTTGSEFRSLAFPALAVDDSGVAGSPGTVYLAWAQRGAAPCLGQPALPVASDAKIVMSTSSDGVAWSPVPCAIDTGAITDDLGKPFSRGNQIMPAMTFIEGKLMLTYYDQRLDHTAGIFVPQLDVTKTFFSPDSAGKFFDESRESKGDPDGSGAPIFTPFIDDAGLTSRRHTIDVNLAQSNGLAPSNGGLIPSFTFARVSSYDFGLFFGEQDTKFHQLKFNPPDLPLFAKGTAPFIGDYIDIAGQMFVPCPNTPQCWAFNNPINPALRGLPAPSPVHYATWTTNQDVIPPFNGDWTTYKPITGNPPAASKYNNDGSLTDPCIPNTGFEGDRNQNIYDSRITQGLLVSSPQLSKPLSTSVQRGFVVLVQNFTNGRAPNFVNYFRLTIPISSQPADGFASFQQLVPPSPVPRPPFPAVVNGMPFPLASVDVAIAPHSGIARTVFAVSSNAHASITVNVQELDGLGGTPLQGGLSSFIVLNADNTVPNSLVDPNGVIDPASSISGVEFYSPNITGPNITGPNITGPNITGPNITGPNITGSNCSSPNITGPNITGSGCTAPNITGPNITGPNITGSTVASPNITGSNVSAPNITGSSVADATYIVGGNQKTGNTHAGQHVKLVGNSPVPLQVTVTQIYTTPNTDGQCHLVDAQQNITLANVPNAAFTDVGQLGNPNITGSDVADATFDLGPNDTAYITIRAQNFTMDQMRDLVTQVTPVVVPEAINSNDTTDTTPPFVAPLFITTAALPDGVVGQSYPPQPPIVINAVTRNNVATAFATMQVIGGTPPYVWNASSLPSGLAINTGTGSITGTPTAANLNNPIVTFTVTDSKGMGVSRNIVLRIADPLAFTTDTLPPAFTGSSYLKTLASSGGISPVTWTLESGPLPNGLFLNPAGTITGMPTATGSFPITLRATDSSTPQQQTAVKSFTMVVATPSLFVTFVSQPQSVQAGQALPPVTIEVKDNSGARIGANVQMSVGNNPCSGTLTGGTSVATKDAGQTTFTTLTLDRGGNGYTLIATATAAGGANGSTPSNVFNIAGFCPTSAMVIPRVDSPGVRLGDGKVLYAGGNGDGGVILQNAELYDPATQSFAVVPNALPAPRGNGHTATLLPDGRVLLAGGRADAMTTVNTADLYLPVSQTFVSTGSMSAPREFHTATLLPSGKVLIVGGIGGQSTLELYDPAENVFGRPVNLPDPRQWHTATLLANGKVFIAGGAVKTTLLYDPVTSATTSGPDLSSVHTLAAAVRLSDGRVLIAGGNDNATPSQGATLATADLYDPIANTITAVGSMNFARFAHTAELLPNGRVLIAYGERITQPGFADSVFASELFDPVTGIFTAGGITSQAFRSRGVFLGNGSILFAGDRSGIPELYLPSP
ncbi:MAG: putative Ig domain-containing protein [Terriglobales bacterium]